MSVTAAIRRMLDAGLTIEQALIASAAFEAEMPNEAPDLRTARQKRNARYYQKKTSEKHLKASGLDDQDALSPSPKEIPPTPPKEITPTQISEPRGSSIYRLREFDQFWIIFPNRVGKRDAEKAFTSARKRAPIDAILAGVSRYAAKTDDRPWCNPATFLNQDRWADQPADQVQRVATSPPPKKLTQATMWHEEARNHGILNDPPSQTDRHLDASLPRGQDQGSGFARRIASA